MTSSNNSFGEVSWSSPSNIALVKYWGKRDLQIPQNPSISFTLNNCKTITKLCWKKKETNDDLFSFDFYLDEKLKESFKVKIIAFFERLSSSGNEFEFLKDYHLQIYSHNTFPHSTGIASSASSMSALALCLLSMREKVLPKDLSEKDFFVKASEMSRIGSGSAGRSIYGELVLWGEQPPATNEYAAAFTESANVFKTYCDSILIVSSQEKSVSSTAGHQLMESHPFAEVRFENAKKNLAELISILKSGDQESFCKLVEREALELHGLMMNSSPSFLLMKPNTLSIIDKIRSFRSSTGVQVCFTLDAGPNVHLLYSKEDEVVARKFIEDELLCLCENSTVIHDHVGLGPVVL